MKSLTSQEAGAWRCTMYPAAADDTVQQTLVQMCGTGARHRRLVSRSATGVLLVAASFSSVSRLITEA
ncbi:hypothetical protein ACWEO2_43760 [Nocardia sp. NPDC004278]